MGIQAIAIGSHAVGLQDYSVVVGASAVASVSKGIALGYGSVADVGDGILGYDPTEDAPSKNKSAAWKSSIGALSIGNPKENITRQITGVASGSEDTDAVNVAQLKALRGMIAAQRSWELSVDGVENTVIGSGETLELKTGSNNFKITSDTRNKKVTFDLAKDITLDSVKLGGEDLAEAVDFVTLDATGLIIKDGPKITTTGISAGNKKITNMAEGTENSDAVNFAQLKELQDNVNKGWNLSVGDKNAKAILMGDTVDFSAESQNIQITKSKDNNNIKFDLATNITLDSIKLGDSTLDKMGLIIKDGPQITTTGVNAGNKKITSVKKGTDETDAVNFAQLKELKDSISTSTSKDHLSEWNKDKVRIGVPGNKAERKGAVAIGRTLEAHETSVLADYGIAIGLGARVKENAKDAISFGRNSEVRAEAGVALGAFSIADRAKYVRGYDPRTGKTSVRDPENPFDGVWENTYGAVSVGASNISTRQIMHVAAGSEDDDAVNVGQLKALREMITKQGSWNLGVGDKKTIVNPSDTLILAAENSNLIITSDDKEKKVTFDLAKDIMLESVKAGANTFDATGLIIKDGPKIMTAGIDAGNKKITGVAEGADDADAVSFAQLKKIKKDVEQQVADSSFVKQDDETKHITIGKDTEGDKIDITNNKNDKRTLTGIKDAALSAESKEAITGSQLFTTNQKVDIVSTNLQTAATNIAKYFGGDAKYQDGKWTDPKFKVKSVKADGNPEERSYTNVAEALAGVGTSITNVQNKMTEQINSAINKSESKNLVKWNEGANLINIGKEKEGSEINITNTSGKDRTLSGVKAAIKNNEAVNKEQFDKELKDLSSSLQSDDSAVVHYDKQKDGQIDYTSVTFGGKDRSFTTLHNVADGIIADKSHDAITGGQIYKIGEDIAKFFGGEAVFNNGAFTGPTYILSEVSKEGEVTNKSFSDIGSAFEGLDTNIKTVNQRIKDVTQSVAQDSLSWSAADKAFSAQHGEGKERRDSKIKFLIGGDLSDNSTEAVNGGQMYTLGSHVARFFGGGAEFQMDNGTIQFLNLQLLTIKARKKIRLIRM